MGNPQTFAIKIDANPVSILCHLDTSVTVEKINVWQAIISI